MLSNLFLASIRILLFFSSLFLLFNSFFMIPVEIENARLRLALIIPIGAPMTVANDAIEMLSIFTDKTVTDLSKYLISATK